ncbi:MAG: DUF4271 domain-containing protein [Flavobacteriales bacterium]
MPEPSIRQAVNLSEDWMIIIFLFSLAVLAYTRKVYPARISRLWSSMWNIRAMRQSIREEPNTPRANLLFNISFYLLAGLMVYSAIKCFRPDVLMGQGFVFYALLVAAVFLVYLVKKIVLRIITVMADGDFSLAEYEYSIFLTNRILGLILFPACLAIAYFPVIQSKTILLTTATLVAIALIYRLLRYMLAAAESGVTLFYILFYICTLEILPSALGIKWLASF